MTSTALSPLRRRELAATARRMSAPMIGAQMIADPFIATRNSAGASLLERRACQYASAIGRRDGTLPADQSALVARFDPMRQAVEFFAGNSAKLYATFAIPDRIMQFDADLTLLCLPAPEIEAPSPCTETAPLQLPEPARALPAPAARKAKAACEPFALKSFWIAGRRGMRRIEGLAL